MTVTIAEPPRPVAASPLAAALPRLLAGAALRVAPEARLAGPASRRRMARALLLDVSEAAGSQVFETLAGELLLFGAPPRAATQAALQLGRLAGLPPPPVWLLPQDAAPLLAWAQDAVLAPPAGPPALVPPTPGLAGLDARLEVLAPERLLRSRPLRRPVPGGGPGTAMATAGVRLRLCRRDLAAELGTLAADPDLLRHAEDRLATRLLHPLAAWALEFPGLWLLPLPRAVTPLPPARPGLIGVLPLAAVGDAGFGAARQALAAQGWGLALEGPEAASLSLFDLTALPADLLLLRWSSALAEPAALAALRRADPARLVLTAAAGAEALEFAGRLGLAAVSGPAVAG
ncbi:hypothetical protein GCM10011504_01450 [Siccirubricoccus deserti]|uniref:EAL domain-containing protein n=1 Tax=Siccirubricoccus deserti TaxID=2013562 RepID=A0A9X0UBM0_9PROT|nr:hypothetical protein [Siccirubricoccus deserti]MBC4014157.1 hypothetical protein [Siccirubricoccus deserti]GGC26994.1 hypothetical protein GCM10011504_01450 [Siccirubricoccus deserti]